MKILLPVTGSVVLGAALASTALLGVSAAHAATPRCQGVPATIVGSAKADTLNGTKGRDVIWAGGGNDRVSARGGDDLVCAGGGADDVHAGNGADRILGESGNDELDSSTGHDDVVEGGSGDDVLTGGSDGARLDGGPGDDELTGNEAGVVLEGGADDDRLLSRWSGVVLHGGDGDDFIDGHWNRDADIDGGAGNDTIEAGGGLDGSPAKPVRGGAGNDHILGQGSRDYVDAGPGDDTVDLGDGDGGWAQGGTGNDTMTSGTTEDTVLSGGAGRDELTLREVGSTADGGADDDTLTGSLWDDQLDGGGGNDTARAGEGDDALTGGDGNDSLFGEEGADVCSGGAGTDTCDGGPLGTPAPSSEDPDLCQSDVETKINCRGDSGDWSGTADGTLVHSGGVTETWSARVDMDEQAAGYYWLGDADIAWRVSGTSDSGCTYDGAANLDGRAEMAHFDWEGEYSVSLWRTTLTAEVVVDCPHAEPETILYNPMNTNAAEADDQALPQGPVSELSGTATYVPMNAPEGTATWSWELQRDS